MDKGDASRVIQNAGMTPYDVANKIYLATVEGVSGANQSEGYGFELSAIAKLWNIKGRIGNPSGKTKITDRYKGMGVTKDMIFAVVSRYPNGIPGNAPLFDDLLGVGPAGQSANRYQGGNSQTDSDTNGGQDETNVAIVVIVVAFIILKFFLKWGWISSIIAAFVIGTIALVLLWKAQGGGK